MECASHPPLHKVNWARVWRIHRKKGSLTVVFVILLEYFIFFGTVGCFIAAGVAEFWAGRKRPSFIFRILEPMAGIIGVVAIPSRFWGVSISHSFLSWAMVFGSFLIAVLAVLSKYTSRFALSCVLVGAAFLAFMWYGNGAYHH